MTEYPAARRDRFRHYLREGFPKLWAQCCAEALEATLYFDEVLHRRGIDGGVAEIGVLEGAFFIGLHNLMPENGYSLAIDCFDSPDYVPDPTGHGCGRAGLKKFRENLDTLAARPERATTVEADSLTLDARDLAKRHGRTIKLFSVDGLHTRAHALHDLHIAEAMLVDEGIIILDDYPNPGCPGVTEAADDFIAEGRFVPIAVGFNKLFLARAEYAQSNHLTVDVSGHPTPRLGWLAR